METVIKPAIETAIETAIEISMEAAIGTSLAAALYDSQLQQLLRENTGKILWIENDNNGTQAALLCSLLRYIMKLL